MFRLTRFQAAEINAAVEMVRDEAAASPRLLSLSDGIKGKTRPLGFAHDCLRSRLGEGEQAFAAARRAFLRWAEFDLGWVHVANPEIPVSIDEIVAVEVSAMALCSLNLSRILEVVDSASKFGFLYSTTSHHAEEGEERFLLELDSSGGVWYHLEAVSRPRHVLARLAYPLTRALQHLFARDSHGCMRDAVRVDLSKQR